MNAPLYMSLINSTSPYPQLAREWVRTALDAGVTNYIIFCADSQSFKELSSAGLRVKRIRPEDYPIPKPTYGPEVHHYITRLGDIPFLKLVAVEESLRDGAPVVFSDVDAFIQKDPSGPIKDLLSLHDVLLSTVNHSNAYPKRARDRWKFSLCSGWMAFQGAPASYKFIQELKNLKVGSGTTDLQLKINDYVLNRAELSKGDDNASFQIDGVRFKLLDQSFVSRSREPIDSYIYHCLDGPGSCLHRVKKAFPSKQK